MAGGSVTSPTSRSPARVRRLFEAAVRRGLATSGLSTTTGPLIIAASGGADSTALLLALRAVLPAIDITVCHIDHGLRGAAERDAEQTLLADLCARLGLPLVVRTVDVSVLQKAARLSPEDAARRLRYAALRLLAEQRAAGVLTGHTRDDQSETVLLRAARGTGLRGLRGLLPRSRLGGDGPLLLRPLLALRHADCIAYCSARAERWSEDSSNASRLYARNRLRHEALPALRGVQPGADAALARLGDQAAQFADWLDGETRDLIGRLLEQRDGDLLLRRPAQPLHPFLAGALVAAVLAQLDDAPGAPAAEVVERLVDLWQGRRGRRYQLRGGRRVRANAAGLLIGRRSDEPLLVADERKSAVGVALPEAR
jgi:tRNA(Ile)-lysidine synthase